VEANGDAFEGNEIFFLVDFSWTNNKKTKSLSTIEKWLKSELSAMIFSNGYFSPLFSMHN
jgi:hypothetical protein